MQLSLIIPLFNEEESLEQLYREICDVADTHHYSIEVIFIDDGSTDQSWSVIEKIIASDSRVRGIQFRRNFGKAAALQAGFRAATGDIILTLDADLQDDPKEIPDFIRLIDSGLDVVSGWKKRRHDPWHKVFPSRVFNAMVSFMTGVKLHDHNCGMKCYCREAIENVTLYGERHRFIPVLSAAQGYKVGEKVVEHRSRQFGKSKYGFARFVKGFLDMLTIWFLTKYGQRPQHILGTFGLGMILLGVFGVCAYLFMIISIIALDTNSNSGGMVSGAIFLLSFWAVPLFFMLFTIGTVSLASGIATEYLAARTIKPEQCYTVKKELGRVEKSRK